MFWIFLKVRLVSICQLFPLLSETWPINQKFLVFKEITVPVFKFQNKTPEQSAKFSKSSQQRRQDNFYFRCLIYILFEKIRKLLFWRSEEKYSNAKYNMQKNDKVAL